MQLYILFHKGLKIIFFSLKKTFSSIPNLKQIF